MVKLKLPVLRNNPWKEGKKSVYEILFPEEEAEFKIKEVCRGFTVVERKGEEYYLTRELSLVPSNAERVLKVRHSATTERLRNEEVKVQKWLKTTNHRTLEEVRKSWVGNFFYKEECSETGSEGLRDPQIGAVK